MLWALHPACLPLHPCMATDLRWAGCTAARAVLSGVRGAQAAGARLPHPQRGAGRRPGQGPALAAGPLHLVARPLRVVQVRGRQPGLGHCAGPPPASSPHRPPAPLPPPHPPLMPPFLACASAETRLRLFTSFSICSAAIKAVTQFLKATVRPTGSFADAGSGMR